MRPDSYQAAPEGSYQERRAAYLEFCAAQSPGGRTGFFSQIARLELGRTIDEGPIHEALALVDSRVDCCDFSVGGLLRILYLYRTSPRLSSELIASIEARILSFKYWWDEAAGDNSTCVPQHIIARAAWLYQA